MEISAVLETNDIFEQSYLITATMYMSYAYIPLITNTHEFIRVPWFGCHDYKDKKETIQLY